MAYVEKTGGALPLPLTTGGYTSDSGCDAGFGAFALLGLAGVAAILRKKD